jgi:hypothetical protein
MFGEYQSFMIFCEGPTKMAHCKQKKLSFEMHPQLINMDLQESMILRVYNIYIYTTCPKTFTQGCVNDLQKHWIYTLYIWLLTLTHTTLVETHKEQVGGIVFLVIRPIFFKRSLLL